jgi:prepilin-type N-terminal cleavage/methylation domain-containing protein
MTILRANKVCLTKERSCSGFTLLEIIIALSIVGIAVVVAMQLFSVNLRAIATSEDYVNAAAGAEAVMRSVLSDDDFPANASSGGVINEYRYESSAVKVNEERTGPANVDLYQVRVTIHWKDGRRDKSITLYSLKMTEKKI